MKADRRIACLLLAACSVATAQIDTSLKVYFPMAVGNTWEYEEEMFPHVWRYQVKAVRDTVLSNGKRYLEYYSGESKFYRMDDSLNVYLFDSNSCSQSEIRVFSLAVPDSTLWSVCRAYRTPYPDTVFGFLSLHFTESQRYFPRLSMHVDTKMYCEATIVDSDTVFGPLVTPMGFIPTRLGRGLGIVWKQSEGPSHDLVGAIIDGNLIGSITSTPLARGQLGRDAADICCFPNPFNSSTTIILHVTTSSDVRLSVIDILGREVWISPLRQLEAGTHRVVWGGISNDNVQLPSGIYYCVLRTGNVVVMQSAILIK
jgi:hypothetical protein